MLLEILEVLPPTLNKKAPRSVDFTEVVLRKRLGDYSPLLDKITGVIKPDQQMCNFICEVIATAQNVQPPYQPYVTVDLRSLPWLIQGIDHERALEAFDRKMRKFHSAQPLGVRQFILYKMRFILAGDCCHAFDKFGGIWPLGVNLFIFTNKLTYF